MIRPLPRWVLTNNYPAFNDTESVTAIEMVARLYGSMQELIKDYNEFVDRVNKEIEDFEAGLYEDFDSFKECIMKLVSDYIESIDIKIGLQDTKIDNAIAEQNSTIAEAVDYMKERIIETTTNLFNEYLQHGDIYVGLKITYDAETEALTLGVEAMDTEQLNLELSEFTTPPVEGGD